MEKARRACEAIFLDEGLPQIIVAHYLIEFQYLHHWRGPTLFTWQAFTNCVLERAGTPCCARTLVLHFQDTDGRSKIGSAFSNGNDYVDHSSR